MRILSCTAFCCVIDLSFLFRLLSQLNEKEREYQELLRNSVQRKQEQIDELKTAQTTEGKVVCLFFKSRQFVTSILIAQELWYWCQVSLIVCVEDLCRFFFWITSYA